MKKAFAIMLAIVMALSLTACGSESEKNNTIVGRWAYIDESEPWEISFTEDGDFYDSLGNIMVTKYNGLRCDTQYGTWRIRADGKIWLTGTVQVFGARGYEPQECEWSCSYELDGDTLRFAGKTFKRIQ